MTVSFFTVFVERGLTNIAMLWDFYNLIFPGEAKMCLGFMSLRATPAALKQKNKHNSTNMQPIMM